MTVRIKASEVAGVRSRLAQAQGGRCSICGGPLGAKAPLDPVLDHDHRTGAVRGVLHRGCNSLLGKNENGAARYGVRDLAAFTSGVGQYLRRHMTNITGLTHYTHKSEDEKRELRNKRARIARAKKKEAAE